MRSLKRLVWEEKYLLLATYKFVLPDTDATVNRPPLGCIAIYQLALTYGLRFRLHEVILEIHNKYELVPTQIASASCHNICSFIAIYEVRKFAA